ncbi:dirigent protein 2-like [Coffea arabica]|uniref:Dirigent protein n=1 Tax=Coffea arabica TaxID=13443 RepID=A0A6P6S9Z5_COFAR|nr:dirigent protein 2-like [Coffea arabica]
MAKSSAIASLQVLSVLLLASLGQSKTVFTNLTVYSHEHQSGDAQSVFPVAGLPNTTWGLHDFGTVFIADNTLTEDISESSDHLGYIQGIAAMTSRDNSTIHVLLTVLFTSGRYNGSTLELQGLNIYPFDVNEEYAIVGGTRQFRYATGYVALNVQSAKRKHRGPKLAVYIAVSAICSISSMTMRRTGCCLAAAENPVGGLDDVAAGGL